MVASSAAAPLSGTRGWRHTSTGNDTFTSESYARSEARSSPTCRKAAPFGLWQLAQLTRPDEDGRGHEKGDLERALCVAHLQGRRAITDIGLLPARGDARELQQLLEPRIQRVTASLKRVAMQARKACSWRATPIRRPRA